MPSPEKPRLSINRLEDVLTEISRSSKISTDESFEYQGLILGALKDVEKEGDEIPSELKTKTAEILNFLDGIMHPKNENKT